MIVLLVQRIESAFEMGINIFLKNQPAETQLASIFKCLFVSRNAEMDLVFADLAEIEGTERFRIGEHETRWQITHHQIFLLPGKMAVDIVLPCACREQESFPFLEKGRLQEQSFAGAFGITGNANLVRIDKRLERISGALDLDVSHLSGADPFFKRITHF